MTEGSRLADDGNVPPIGGLFLAGKFQHVVGVVHEIRRVLDGDDGVARIGEPVD